VIGAGTGLGEALVLPDGGGSRVLPSEGGHTTFAPSRDDEIAVLRFLLQRHEHVSWERVLSGDGLVNLAEALAAHQATAPPDALARQIARDRSSAPALVTELARGGEALCAAALRLFCRLYGSEAGNLALKSLPTGGLYVAGGIAPRILPELTSGEFREAFLAKGRMRPVLEKIPVHVVLDPQTPLHGAAALAAS
jgi:glucokinase